MRRVLVALLSLFCAVPVWSDAAAEGLFRKGIAAADLERWDEAADWLRRAIDADANESQKRVVISGVFSQAYLPHYHLGRVLFAAGEAGCAEALTAWAESTRQGVIANFPRLSAELESSRQQCRRIVFPDQAVSAQAAIDRASDAARQVPQPLSVSGDETERRAAIAQLDLARERLASARRDVDPALAEEARRGAEQAARRFDSLAQKNADARERALAEASDTARRALGDAEQARLSLAGRNAEPELLAARRSRPGAYDDLAVPAAVAATLAELRRRQIAATDVAEYRQITGEAEALTSQLEQIEERAVRVLADLRADLSAARPTPADAEPTSAGPTVAGSSPTGPSSAGPSPPRAAENATSPGPATASPARLDQGPETSPQAPAIDAQLRSLLASCDTLLGRLSSVGEGEGGELLETQRARLTALSEAARSSPADAALKRRLASSLAALQVVAGGAALLDGRTEDAEAILSARALPGDRIGAQGLLLRAAARHRLARTDDQRAATWLDRAGRDLDRFRALGGQLDGENGPPQGARFFSGDFWRFVEVAAREAPEAN